MNELAVKIFKGLVYPRAVFVHHEASFWRKTNRLDCRIICPCAVLVEAEEVRARLDEGHVSLADDRLPRVLVVVRVDDHLGNGPWLTGAAVLVPAPHDQLDLLEAGLPLRAEHLAPGLELRVTLHHGPAQAVGSRDDVAPKMC